MTTPWRLPPNARQNRILIPACHSHHYYFDGSIFHPSHSLQIIQDASEEMENDDMKQEVWKRDI
jgi:hypothetical protein